MDTFLMIAWPLLIIVSYRAIVYALNKAGKL